MEINGVRIKILLKLRDISIRQESHWKKSTVAACAMTNTSKRTDFNKKKSIPAK